MINMTSRQSRNLGYRTLRKKMEDSSQMMIYPVRKFLAHHKVPLVSQYDDTLASIKNEASDVSVLSSWAFKRINYNNPYVGMLNRSHCAQHAVLLDPRIDVSPSPNTGRIHNPNLLAFPLEQRVNTVTCGPGGIVYKGSRLSQ